MRTPQFIDLPASWETEVPMETNWPATWSKLSTYAACPWKFWLTDASKYVTGNAIIPFTSNRATELGEKKHALYESAAFSLKNGCRVPEDIQKNPLWNAKVGRALESMMQSYSDAIIEEKIGIDAKWQAWSLNNYWQPAAKLFGTNKMLIRAKFDLGLFNKAPYGSHAPTHGILIDYKSGKPRKPELWGQLALYAMVSMCRWPTLNVVDCIYIFLDHDAKYEQRYQRSQLLHLKAYFLAKILEVQHYIHMSESEPQVNSMTPTKCNWCNATKDQCRYSEKG